MAAHTARVTRSTSRRHALPLVLALCMLTSCATPTPAPITEPALTNTASWQTTPVIEIAAVGDSITAWIDRNGETTPCTWVCYLGDDLTFQGQGWAAGGAQLAEMAAHITPVDVDVIVIMAGTNDLGTQYGTPMAERIASLKTIVDQAQADRVVIAAVPPFSPAPQWALEWNTTLQLLAAEQGWQYIDPWPTLRAHDGRWVSDASTDDIHPTDTSSRLAGAALSAAIVNAQAPLPHNHE